jgi:hypothetical protein
MVEHEFYYKEPFIDKTDCAALKRKLTTCTQVPHSHYLRCEGWFGPVWVHGGLCGVGWVEAVCLFCAFGCLVIVCPPAPLHLSLSPPPPLSLSAFSASLLQFSLALP